MKVDTGEFDPQEINKYAVVLMGDSDLIRMKDFEEKFLSIDPKVKIVFDLPTDISKELMGAVARKASMLICRTEAHRNFVNREVMLDTEPQLVPDAVRYSRKPWKPIDKIDQALPICGCDDLPEFFAFINSEQWYEFPYNQVFSGKLNVHSCAYLQEEPNMIFSKDIQSAPRYELFDVSVCPHFFGRRLEIASAIRALESIYCGVPVLTNVRYPYSELEPEILKNIFMGSPSSILEPIGEYALWLSNPSQAAQNIEAAQDIIQERYTVEAIAPLWISVLKKVYHDNKNTTF